MPDSEKLTSSPVRAIISVSGVVQGVGFRPFIFQQATERGLTGRVINTSAGVEIDVEGPADRIDSLLALLKETPPPRALITEINRDNVSPVGYTRFRIGSSVATRGRHQLVSPDTCTCDQCLSELMDPEDRRYRYPFINCTNCGPRFTIIEGLPYDRGRTTMKNFGMCPTCLAEYEDPRNRRFHAEPNACPDCGPSLWLTGRDGVMLPSGDAVRDAAAAILDGKIVALKGLGGFQLACLATSADAVKTLRRRKHRPHKPFAIMIPSLEDAALNCRISAEERRLLESVPRPIVLIDRLDGGDIAGDVSPGLTRLGVMLPYTPLHYLLMDDVRVPLVMTSGNMSDEPICRTNDEAVERLAKVADLFLLHDREILSTYDDSVVTVDHRGRQMMIRRARGYAPLPVRLPAEPGDDAETSREPVLAAGGELKNAFCLTRGRDAFISQHIGDLESRETMVHFERTEELYERLFNTRPRRLVCDKHPGYLSSSYTLERGAERGQPVLQVQHHRAHVASCLAENGFTGTVVGIALDGTGLGDDGAIWGGEFFTGSLIDGFTRAAHVEYFPLLGGEAAIREPWRTALALTWLHAPEKVDFMAELLGVQNGKKDLILRQLRSGLNCPETSSCGRLFDAIGAMALGRHAVTYEAQAAMELEAVASGGAGQRIWQSTTDALPYSFSLCLKGVPWRVSPAAAIRQTILSIENDEAPSFIAARFHLGLAEAIVQACTELAARSGLKTVALSGGVWQNQLLFGMVEDRLDREGFTVLTHHQLPPNDGGLSLGQASMAMFAGPKTCP